ncbi:MAG: PaaI family thioesterase [Gammaproteobacteria bacterium AqS3]|nr:PaaI family thioesterase [Gammaproteobacteria bacterium AqS3]
MSIVIPEGWSHYSRDQFENHLGPLFYRVDRERSRLLAMMHIGEHHYNGIGTVHGGVTMTMADYALCLVAFLSPNAMAGAVTVNMKVDFIGGARNCDTLRAEAELVHETGKLMFGRGQIETDSGPIAVFSGCVKPYATREDSAITRQVRAGES